MIYSFCVLFTPKDHPRSPNWTLDLEPAFSQRFYFPLSPPSLFHIAQRFPIPNHVTSGCMSPRSFFPPGQRFPILKHVTSGSHEPAIPFLPTGQRFPPPEVPLVTCSLSTNQKPGNLPYGRNVLLL